MSDVVYTNHLGIIMDGNGRWTKERGLNRSAGHKAGADNLINLLDYIYKNTSLLLKLCPYMPFLLKTLSVKKVKLIT